MNICIDIDGTITTDDAWVKFANRHFGTFISREDMTSYDIHTVLGVERSEYESFYEQWGEKMHKKAPIRPFAKQILRKLEKRHKLFYVTAREEQMRKVTKQWIGYHRLPNIPLHMTGSHYKVDKAKSLHCDIFIEDRYENAVQLALAGYQVLLVDCPYNRKTMLPNMKRVFSWQDIELAIVYLEECQEKESVLVGSKKGRLAFEF